MMDVHPVYLLDFSAYRSPEEFRFTAREVEKHADNWTLFNEEQRRFTHKIFIKSGLSPNATYVPACIHAKHTTEPTYGIMEGAAEAEMCMGGAVAELLEKMGMRPTDIDILVTVTSIVCPTPSISSMIVNKFKMRSDIQSFHLAGMGCANGVVGINLIRDMLKAHPNSIALFVACEPVSYCFYAGTENDYMVANTIFRMGAGAALLTNKPSLYPLAKYKLLHAVRVHMAADDASYGCMGWKIDKAGLKCVYLGKDVISCAGAGIAAAVYQVAPKIMTWQQYGEALYNIASRKARKLLGLPDVPMYIPDFTKYVDHFVIHSGAYGVLKGIQKSLRLPARKMIPSFSTLSEYGNTSGSSTWYTFAYTESCEEVKKGQVVLQIGVGAGIKAGCNVWRALQDIKGDRRKHQAWAHLGGKGIPETDLPRAIDDGEVRDPFTDSKYYRPPKPEEPDHASAAL